MKSYRTSPSISSIWTEPSISADAYFLLINPKLVVIDHINLNTIEEIIDEDFTIGLTVQPQKMEVEEAVEILGKYGFDKFLLNRMLPISLCKSLLPRSFRPARVLYH